MKPNPLLTDASLIHNIRCQTSVLKTLEYKTTLNALTTKAKLELYAIFENAFKPEKYPLEDHVFPCFNASVVNCPWHAITDSYELQKCLSLLHDLCFIMPCDYDYATKKSVTGGYKLVNNTHTYLVAEELFGDKCPFFGGDTDYIYATAYEKITGISRFDVLGKFESKLIRYIIDTFIANKTNSQRLYTLDKICDKLKKFNIMVLDVEEANKRYFAPVSLSDYLIDKTDNRLKWLNNDDYVALMKNLQPAFNKKLLAVWPYDNRSCYWPSPYEPVKVAFICKK